VLAVAPALTMDEASSLSWYLWSERNKLWLFRFACFDHGRSIFYRALTLTLNPFLCVLFAVNGRRSEYAGTLNPSYELVHKRSDIEVHKPSDITLFCVLFSQWTKK